MRWQPQQTVKLAIDCKTGEPISAESLLILDEAKFTEMRRSAMEARVNRKRGGSTVRFQCAICKRPLFLSRYRSESVNRWFVHDGKAEGCPWYEGNRPTPDQTKALIYRGQQEGAKHQEYKRFLAQWLNKNPSVSDIALEQTTFSQVMKGEWRRPDVKCFYKGRCLVFEIQLSYTFLSDVIARDEFYKRDGIFIIWVFANFDLNRAAVSDEAFFNRRNLFVLDSEAINKTSQSTELTFSGYRQAPILIDGHISDIWNSEFVTLDQVSFPLDTFRPYFFDYDTAHKALEADLWTAKQIEQNTAWENGLQEYIALALSYYDSDHSKDIESRLLAKVDELEESSLWHRGYEVMRETEFYGWHSVLSILLSIKLGRSVSYSRKLSVFQVIEAGLRTGRRTIGPHAYSILYLWAYKAYKPEMNEKNRNWLINYAHKVKQSIDKDEVTYRRFSGYDETICILFPELTENLSTSFGCL